MELLKTITSGSCLCSFPQFQNFNMAVGLLHPERHATKIVSLSKFHHPVTRSLVNDKHERAKVQSAVSSITSLYVRSGSKTCSFFLVSILGLFVCPCIYDCHFASSLGTQSWFLIIKTAFLAH